VSAIQPGAPASVGRVRSAREPGAVGAQAGGELLDVETQDSHGQSAICRLTVWASPLAAEYLAGESGILIILGYGIAAAWLLRRMGLRTS
jgi:hypothetical protein